MISTPAGREILAKQTLPAWVLMATGNYAMAGNLIDKTLGLRVFLL